MCLVKYHVLILCLLALECYALNCRTDGGPKEAELKNIYKKCLKMQENKNSSRSNEQDWKDSRGQSQRNDWNTEKYKDRDNRSEGRDRVGSGMRDRDDMMGRNDNRGRNNDRNMNNDRFGGNDRMGNSDRMGSTDRMGTSEKMGYEDRMGSDGRRNEMGSRNEMKSGRGQNGRDDYLNGRGEFGKQEEYGSDMYSNHNNYYASTQMPRRYKRDRKPENSGQRSQYNPNIQKITGYEDNFRSEEKNSSENNSSKESDNKACALHCFLENLEMTAEDGMPDRYLVTHAITKDVKNEDLRDFLQESVEECFQILDNENTEDKCEFSKNLLMCLSEKGRSNCDDWKDDLKF